MGMMGGGALMGTACLILRGGWRWLPAAMTAGGVWALIPDLPRVFREDITGLPGSSILGSPSLERWLHHIGNLFFFHQALDAQPKEYALLGVVIILVLYNASLVMLMVMEQLQRNSLANRAFAAHGAKVLMSRSRSHRRSRSHHHDHDEAPHSSGAQHAKRGDRPTVVGDDTSARTGVSRAMPPLAVPVTVSVEAAGPDCPDVVARIGDHAGSARATR
jgi:hypothetical protein